MADIQRIQKDVGETNTLKVLSSDVNKWGDQDGSYTEQELHGVFQIVSREMEEEEEGDFVEGDLRVWVDGVNDNDLNHGNRIVYDGRDYEIDSVDRQNTVGGETHIEITARPV